MEADTRAFVGWADYLAAADPPDEPAGSRRSSPRSDSWEKDLEDLGPVEPAEFFDFGGEEPAYESAEARAERELT